MSRLISPLELLGHGSSLVASAGDQSSDGEVSAPHPDPGDSGFGDGLDRVPDRRVGRGRLASVSARRRTSRTWPTSRAMTSRTPDRRRSSLSWTSMRAALTSMKGAVSASSRLPGSPAGRRGPTASRTVSALAKNSPPSTRSSATPRRPLVLGVAQDVAVLAGHARDLAEDGDVGAGGAVEEQQANGAGTARGGGDVGHGRRRQGRGESTSAPPPGAGSCRRRRTEQRPGGGVQPDHRRHARDRGVGERLGHQHRPDRQPGDHIAAQPTRVVAAQRGEQGAASPAASRHRRPPPGGRSSPSLGDVGPPGAQADLSARPDRPRR